MTTFPNVAVGDAVAYTSYLQREPRKLLVTKVTATQIEVTGGSRFSRGTGKSIGVSSSRSWVKPWTAEVDQQQPTVRLPLAVRRLRCRV